MKWRSALNRVRAFAGALDRDGAIARALVLAGDRDLNLDLASALDLALGSTLDGAYAPDRAATPDLDLSRDLASALASYHDLLRALASYPALDRDRDLVGDFARYRDLAQDLARCLDQHSTKPVASVAGTQPMPGRGPLGLVTLAVLLLPRSWQPRYREEFRAELARLSPGERYEYARRVLAAGWKLRRTLAGTQCPPDGARVEG